MAASHLAPGWRSLAGAAHSFLPPLVLQLPLDTATLPLLPGRRLQICGPAGLRPHPLSLNSHYSTHNTTFPGVVHADVKFVGSQGLLASASADKTTKVWRQAAEGGAYDCAHTFTEQSGEVVSVCVHPRCVLPGSLLPLFPSCMRLCCWWVASLCEAPQVGSASVLFLYLGFCLRLLCR